MIYKVELDAPVVSSQAHGITSVRYMLLLFGLL